MLVSYFRTSELVPLLSLSAVAGCDKRSKTNTLKEQFERYFSLEILFTNSGLSLTFQLSWTTKDSMIMSKENCWKTQELTAR